MIKVRITVHSSVHAQNATLHEFLGQGLDTSAQARSRNALSKMLQLSREDLFQRSFQSASPSDSSHDTERLQISVVDIANGSMCPVSGVSDHLIRIVNHLWQAIVFGCGEANPRWANPGSFQPLRVQAFATLLQVLGSTSVYYSKRGLSQLDGSGKWNLILLGRILALAFDEGQLFGETAEESLDERFLMSFRERANSERSKGLRRKHVRSRFEFSTKPSTNSDEGIDPVTSADLIANNRVSGALDSQNFSFSLQTTSSSRESGAINSLSDDKESGSTTLSQEASIRVDSVTDFRSALNAGFGKSDDDAPVFDGSQSGSKAAMPLVKAYSGPQGMNRRWMTAPAPGLATIREDGDDGVDESMNVSTDVPSTTRRIKGPLDSLDTELIVKTGKNPVKQMRVPKVTNKANDQDPTVVGEVDKPQHAGLSSVPIALDAAVSSYSEAGER
jgi:hypothetical protein